MRVLYAITRADTVGGAQAHVRDLAATLTQCGHSALVLTGQRGIFNDALDALGLENRAIAPLDNAIAPLQDWRALQALRAHIRAFEPDLVATHSSKAGILGRVAARLEAKPAVFTAHGWAFTPGIAAAKRQIYCQVERVGSRLCDRIICVSDFDHRLAFESGFPARQLITIHNGMPEPLASPRANPRGSGPLRLAMIARFDNQKDHLTLFKAARRLPGLHLELIGHGPGEDAAKALVTDWGMGDRVTFHGFRHDIPRLLAEAHLFALISNFEGFPLATLEAMQAGLPVIVSDVGGAGEAVEAGQTGFTVPRGDDETLYQRLLELAGSPVLRERMGAAGRRRYEERFSFERMAKATFGLYADVLAERRGTN